MTVKRAFAAVLIPILVVLLPMTSRAQGLGFHGMDYRIDERTSYDVFGKRAETFTDDLSIEFELYTEPISEFGYFFRLKDESRGLRIWNLSYDARGDSIVIRLNEEGRQSLIKAIIPHENLKHLHWHRVKLDFDLLRDSVRLDIAGKVFRTGFPGLPDKVKASVIFGRSDHIIDVPSFAIRKLSIGGGNRRFVFPLDSSEGNIVCDTGFRVEGRVENPEWLINNAMQWKECGSFSYGKIAGAGYNPVRKEFYHFTDEEMTILNLMNDRIDRYRFSSPCPVAMKLGNNTVSTDGSKILCYELYNDETSAGSPSAASFDLDSGIWKTLGTDRLNMPVHHHSGFINPETGRYIIFGGFGNMLYNGSFYEFHPDSGQWKEIWQDQGGDTIYPRYFTSSGTDGKYIYIYGGMGNECGEQVVGRRYFYDLHRIDPQTGTGGRLWTLDWDETDKVPVRNLIVDGDVIYTLCYPEYIGESELYLYRFSIADGTKERLCNSIPIISDKMRTNANIYLDRDLGRFFATVQEFEDDVKPTLKIYSLSYPPVAKARNLSDERKHLLVFFSRKGWITGLGALLLISFAAYAARCLKKRRKESSQNETVVNRRIFKAAAHPDSICLFGDFTVTGHNGEDITSLFTNQQILILCLLIKRRENGISTKHLSSVLWPDKEEEKVKNSRGVAINNLRKSLSHLQGAAVNYSDGRYYLELGDACSCDLFSLMDSLKEKNVEKDRILSIISRGKFLKSINEDIFDEFKEKTDNVILPLLQEEIESRFKSRNYEAVYEIWEMISRIDPVDENSLRTVIRALKRQKRIEEALVTYSTFCTEYKKANDADFGMAFKAL